MGRVRAVQQGIPSEKGQENALYQNRFLTNTTHFPACCRSVRLAIPKSRVPAPPQLGTRPRLSSVFPFGPPVPCGSGPRPRSSQWFYSAIYWAPDHEGRAGERIQVTLQEKTGLVTFYSVSADKGREDLDESLNAYRD